MNVPHVTALIYNVERGRQTEYSEAEVLILELFNRLIASINNLDAITWIAFGSMLAAFIAASEAIRSRRISSRMYDIAVHEKLRTETPLDVYLVDSRILHVPNEQRRVYVFEVLITNKSAAPNSIKKLSLSLEYDRQKRPPSNLTIQHDSIALDSAPTGQVSNALSVPKLIAPGEAISGTALFPVANVILEHGLVDMYTVMVLDAHDRAAECQAILLKETDW